MERKSMSPLYSSRISDFAPRTMKKVGNFLILSFFTTASSDFLTKPNLIERLNTESDDRALRIVGILSLSLKRITFGLDGSETKNVSAVSAVSSVTKFGIILLSAFTSFSFFMSPVYLNAGMGFKGKNLIMGVSLASWSLQNAGHASQLIPVIFAIPFSSLATSLYIVKVSSLSFGLKKNTDAIWLLVNLLDSVLNPANLLSLPNNLVCSVSRDPLRLVRCAEGIPETVRGLTTDARTSLAVVRIGLVAL